MRQRVDTDDLELGMFVAELDRPWLESPFLFQGFLIENEQDLATLRDVCEYVFVDPERSRGAREARSPAAAAPPARVVSERSSRRPRRTPVDAVRANDPRLFAESFQQVMKLQKRAHLALIRMIDERRIGRLVSFEPVLDVVRELTERVLQNQNIVIRRA